MILIWLACDWLRKTRELTPECPSFCTFLNSHLDLDTFCHSLAPFSRLGLTYSTMAAVPVARLATRKLANVA